VLIQVRVCGIMPARPMEPAFFWFETSDPDTRPRRGYEDARRNLDNPTMAGSSSASFLLLFLASPCKEPVEIPREIACAPRKKAFIEKNRSMGKKIAQPWDVPFFLINSSAANRETPRLHLEKIFRSSSSTPAGSRRTNRAGPRPCAPGFPFLVAHPCAKPWDQIARIPTRSALVRGGRDRAGAVGSYDALSRARLGEEKKKCASTGPRRYFAFAFAIPRSSRAHGLGSPPGYIDPP